MMTMNGYVALVLAFGAAIGYGIFQTSLELKQTASGSDQGMCHI